ncbi:hypothetical protein ABK040_015493 [Willaertia magna]
MFGRKKNKSFNPNQYMVVYDAVMDVEESRNFFRDYLKSVANEEPILFLDELENYKKCLQNDNIFKIQSEAKKLMDKYIIPGILNLNGRTRNECLQQWSELTKEQSNYNEATMYNTQLTTSTNEILLPTPTTPTNTSSVKEKYITLFDQIEISTHIDLKLDQFPRFVRYDGLKQFLSEKGEEFCRRIALDISKGFEVDIRYKPKDLVDPFISDKDIYFILSLLEDSPDWYEYYRSNKQSEKYCFQSNSNYTIGTKVKGLKLAKQVIYLPFPRDWVFAKYCESETRKQVDPLISILSCYRYVEPDTLISSSKEDREEDRRSPYAVNFVNYVTKPANFLKARAMHCACTSIYDPQIDCVINYYKSVIDPDNSELEKNSIPMEILTAWCFFKINDNLTRYEQVCYLDIKLPFNSDMMFRSVGKQRINNETKFFFDMFEKNKEKITKIRDGLREDDDIITQCSSYFETDDLQHLKTMKDNFERYPNRSWYNEWIKLKEKVNFV